MCLNFCFQTTGPEHRVLAKDFRELDWLFPETTKNFNKLPLQYRVGLFYMCSMWQQCVDLLPVNMYM